MARVEDRVIGQGEHFLADAVQQLRGITVIQIRPADAMEKDHISYESTLQFREVINDRTSAVSGSRTNFAGVLSK